MPETYHWLLPVPSAMAAVPAATPVTLPTPVVTVSVPSLSMLSWPDTWIVLTDPAAVLTWLPPEPSASEKSRPPAPPTAMTCPAVASTCSRPAPPCTAVLLWVRLTWWPSASVNTCVSLDSTPATRVSPSNVPVPLAPGLSTLPLSCAGPRTMRDALEAGQAVARHRHRDRGVVQHRHRLRAAIVGDLVALHQQGRPAVGNALPAEVDGGRVLGLRPLLDQVAGDDGLAAVGKVDAVAGGAVCAIGDQVAGDGRAVGAALDLVPHADAGEAAVLDRELLDGARIQVVRQAVAVAVVAEVAVLDQEGPARHRGGHQAVLVVMEAAVAEREVAAFVPNPGAVLVRDLAAGEADVLDGAVRVHAQDGLAVGRAGGRDQVDHAADADDGHLGRYIGDVVCVGAGVHEQRVAIPRRREGRSQGGVGLRGAHAQDVGVRWEVGRRDRQQPGASEAGRCNGARWGCGIVRHCPHPCSAAAATCGPGNQL